MTRLWWIALILCLPVAAQAGVRKEKKVEKKAAPEPAPAEEEEKPELPPGTHLGPYLADLGNDLQVAVPEGYVFFERAAADRAMRQMGNFENEDLLGLITRPEADWLVVFEYSDDGYVKDDEADKLDNDALLDAMKQGTEQANEERIRQGFPPVHVVGWSEPPRYDKKTHQMVWGVEGKGNNAEGKEERVINYRTRVLGRRGVAALNLIDSPDGLAVSKAEVTKLLAATQFKQGGRYEDFDPSRDKVAEYGLAALVLGGAGAAAVKAVKIGLLAKFGAKLIAIIIAGKKVFILLLIGLAAGIAKLMGRKKKDAPVATAAPAAAPPAAPAPQAAPPETPPTSAAGGTEPPQT